MAKKKTREERIKERKEAKEKARRKSYYQEKLQREINEIVRILDFEKPCISCDHGKDGEFIRTRNAGHYFAVGSGKAQLRYHLDNIHVQCVICNCYKSANLNEYRKGLIKRYGNDYVIKIERLAVKYESINLTIEDLKEYCKKAKEIKKEMLKGKEYTRDDINILIGIYI